MKSLKLTIFNISLSFQNTISLLYYKALKISPQTYILQSFFWWTYIRVAEIIDWVQVLMPRVLQYVFILGCVIQEIKEPTIKTFNVVRWPNISFFWVIWVFQSCITRKLLISFIPVSSFSFLLFVCVWFIKLMSNSIVTRINDRTTRSSLSEGST